MAKKKTPPESFTRDFFVQKGREGGKVGGKRSLETMTEEQRKERARKAVAARKWHPVDPAAKKKKPAKKRPAKKTSGTTRKASQQD